MVAPTSSPAVERRLAAILAADVVGYSRLVERDEAGTLARLKALRKDLLEPILARHGGRIVKLMGDGALVEFASVVGAVQAAIECQRAVTEHEAALPAGERIAFRIGVNLGDIVLEPDGDILGDGVNIAARLEQLAEPGGICVSEAVVRGLRASLPVGIDDLGPQRLKNIREPVRAYRLILDGSRPGTFSRRRLPALAAAALFLLLLAGGAGAWWWRTPADPSAPPLSDKPSIAVLPFDNLSGDERLQQLADGMAADIVTVFSSGRNFVIIAHGVSAPYGAGPHDIRHVGRELGATYIVDGTLRAEGRGLEATAQLVDVATGAQLWTETFNRPADDPSAAQAELARRIANAVLPIGAAFRAAADAARRRPVESLRPHDLVILALDQRLRWTKEANAKAIELAQRAVELDPRSAAAQVQLAMVYQQGIDRSWAADFDETMAGWLKAATMAAELDPTYPFARFILGKRYAYGFKVDRALAEFNRAIELAPNDAENLANIAEELPWLGQPQRAVELVERAVRLSPDRGFKQVLAIAYFFARRFEEAVERIDDPGSWQDLLSTVIYAQLGRTADLGRWRGRLRENWPDYVYEDWVSRPAAIVPEATAERELWLDSLRKAEVPICVTPEQLAAAPEMKRLPECDAERARAAARS